MTVTITDHWLEYGARTSLVLDERFKVVLVSAAPGGVTMTVKEGEPEIYRTSYEKMEFLFHVRQAPVEIDSGERTYWVGCAMGTEGSLHVFYEIPPQGIQ